MKTIDHAPDNNESSASTDDIVSLFRQFGGESKSYLDIQDSEAALRARDRWLLLREGNEPDVHEDDAGN